MSWHPRQLTAAQREERRLAAGRLLRAGRYSQAEIARQFGVSRAAVSHWARRLRGGPGLASLRARPRSGRPPRLSLAQGRQVLARLAAGARAAGFDTERWTLRRIAVLLRREFGVRYHPHSLSALLRAWGWSPQRPATQARERDERAVTAWRQRLWPRLKRGPGAPAARWSSSTRPATPSEPAPGPPGRRSAAPRSCGE
jgi:putative transposase